MITRLKTDSREAWRRLRGKYLGGSDAAAALGLNPYRSPYALWAEKTGAAPPFAGNLATDLGLYLESFVADRFEAETGKRLRRCRLSLVNDAYPWAIANVDRLVVGEDAGVELKTTALGPSHFSDACPALYRAQCVHYLAVTGRARWYLALLMGNSGFRIYTVERDEAEIAKLMEAERVFWLEHVEKRVPPDPDGSASTGETLRALYPEAASGAEADLSAAEESLEAYLTLTERISKLETERDEHANRVKALLGDKSEGASPRFRASWKNRRSSSFDTKLFRDANPALDLSPYMREKSSRVFRVTERREAAP